KLAQNLMNEMDQFRLTENGLAWVRNGQVGKRSRLRLAAPPAIDQVNLVARTIHEAVQQAGRQKVYFDAICPKPQDWLKGSAGEGLSLPIGLFGASTVKRLVFNDSFVHALIVGKIGSGKSELIHTILAQALLNYAPEELQIYLVDFKSGVEAKIYADYCLPNFRAISVNSEPEFGLSVLKELEAEGERRSGLLKDKNYSNIREYNADPANAGNKLPRILFVADEFHSMLKAPDGEMSKNCAQ
ncbi:MAG: hypothetical protein IIV90_01485, partial [Oscillospiraceae bacterium]|nr:hypothetical protein [Oscillospiraceae bacterium]